MTAVVVVTVAGVAVAVAVVVVSVAVVVVFVSSAPHLFVQACIIRQCVHSR